MDITEACKLIISKCSTMTAEEAIRTMAAARNNSPVLNTRYLHLLQRALADPEAELTQADRAELASAIETPESNTRNHTLQVRLNDEEYEWVKNAADYYKLSLSEYARQIMFKGHSSDMERERDK